MTSKLSLTSEDLFLPLPDVSVYSVERTSRNSVNKNAMQTLNSLGDVLSVEGANVREARKSAADQLGQQFLDARDPQPDNPGWLLPAGKLVAIGAWRTIVRCAKTKICSDSNRAPALVIQVDQLYKSIILLRANAAPNACRG